MENKFIIYFNIKAICFSIFALFGSTIFCIYYANLYFHRHVITTIIFIIFSLISGIADLVYLIFIIKISLNIDAKKCLVINNRGILYNSMIGILKQSTKHVKPIFIDWTYIEQARIEKTRKGRLTHEVIVIRVKQQFINNYLSPYGSKFIRWYCKFNREICINLLLTTHKADKIISEINKHIPK